MTSNEKQTKDDFDFVEPDKFKLDEECVKQPGYVMEYGLQLADAEAEYLRAKAEKEVIRAEIDRDIRSIPEDYEISKITEETVKSVILIQPRYKRAVEKEIVAGHKVDVLKTVMEALRHRKSSLEGLLHLQAQMYFGEPRTSETKEARTKEIRQKGQKPSNLQGNR